jgi:hypothetical protein
VALESSSESYTVSKALLCQASPFFLKALTGNFNEAKERTLRLPGCEPDVFELFLHYLYERSLPDFEDLARVLRAGKVRNSKNATISTTQRKLIGLWCFADERLMPALQNDAMRALLVVLNHWVLMAENARLAYECTSPDSAMRRVAIAERATHWIRPQGDGTEAEFDTQDCFSKMATIGGFLNDFTRQVVACKTKTCGHDAKSCWPSRQNDQEQYMVPEE